PSSLFCVLYCPGDRRDLPSFPTRRSSDLVATSRISAPSSHESQSLREASITASASCHASSSAGAGRRPKARASSSVSETPTTQRSEEHTSELQSRENLVCRLLLEKKKKTK